MLRGIDVSSYQGTVDFVRARAAMDLRFAYVKCAEGMGPGRDSHYAANVAGARAAGLAVGAYFFVHPLPGLDPVAQARFHFSQADGVGTQPGDLPPAIDVESPPPQDWGRIGCSGPQIRAWLGAYVAELARLFGRRPIVYTYQWWAVAANLAAEPELAVFGLWMAAYALPHRWPTEGEAPFIPKPWTNWTFWQCSGGTMTLPNGTAVDVDVFNGGEAELAALTMSAAAGPLAHDAIQQSSAQHPIDVHPAIPPPPDDVA